MEAIGKLQDPASLPGKERPDVTHWVGPSRLDGVEKE
jgi:hypothetical protein